MAPPPDLPPRLRPAARLDGLGVTLIRRILAEAPPGALHLGLGVSNVDVPEPVRDAVVGSRALVRADYGANAGDPALREAIARRYDGLDPARVIVTSGVQEGIALAILGSVDPGDEVLVPDPGFPVYANLTRIAGATPVPYRPSADHRMRPRAEDIAPHLGERTRLVVLCSPGNPTGATAEPAQWQRIAALLADAGVGVLSDEIYLDLQHGDPHPSMLTHLPDAIVLGGPAKTHGLAGWRVGWLVAPEPLVAPLTALHQHLVTSASTLVQAGAIAALEDPACEAGVTELADRLAERRRRAIDALERAGWNVVAGDGAFYLWLRLDGWHDDLALCRALMRDVGVVTIPGSAFGEAGRSHLRLSYSVDDPILDEALTRLARFAAT